MATNRIFLASYTASFGIGLDSQTIISMDNVKSVWIIDYDLLVRIILENFVL